MKFSILREKYIHDLFDLGVILKGIDGLIEAAGGLFLMFSSRSRLDAIVSFFTRAELVEDPHDAIANYLTHAFRGFSGAAQFFGSAYLLLHGVVKIALVVGLLRNRLWAYPVAIAVFGAFGLYQLYYIFLDYSPFLVALTVLDLAIILLTWHEYRYRKAHRSFAG